MKRGILPSEAHPPPHWPCHRFLDFFQRTTGISGSLTTKAASPSMVRTGYNAMDIGSYIRNSMVKGWKICVLSGDCLFCLSSRKKAMSPPSVVSNMNQQQDANSSPVKDPGKIMVNGTETDTVKTSTKPGPSSKSTPGKKTGLGVSTPSTGQKKFLY